MICAALTVVTLLAASAPAKRVAAARPLARPAATAKAQPRRFAHWIEDLPVMPGLTETNDGYSFEIFQGGRLAEARLAGAQTPLKVRRFYVATLPALGWKPSPGELYAWKRGRERLILHISPAAHPKGTRGAKAVFVLTPQGAAKGSARSAAAASKDVL